MIRRSGTFFLYEPFASKDQYKTLSSFCKGVAQVLFIESLGLPFIPTVSDQEISIIHSFALFFFSLTMLGFATILIRKGEEL